MLSIFRIIRRDLVEKHKYLRYLTYATGEIFLVVIGILIAVQVNQCNRGREEAEMEQQYLKNITSNIENSRQELERVIQDTDTRIHEMDSIWAATSNGVEQIIDSAMIGWVVRTADYTIYTADDSAVKELLSTGRLILIKDPVLREFISSRESHLHEIGKYEQECIYWYRQYNDYIEEHLDWYELLHSDINNPPHLATSIFTSRTFNRRLLGLYINTIALNGLYWEEPRDRHRRPKG